MTFAALHPYRRAMSFSLVDFLQALAAGDPGRQRLCPDVRRPRHHLRRDAGDQFRPGRFPDARHVRRVLSGDRSRAFGVFRAQCRADRRGVSRRADRVRVRLAGAPLYLSRASPAPGAARSAGRGRLRPDPDDAGDLADPAEWRADRLRLDPDRHPHATVAVFVGDRRGAAEPGALRQLCGRGGSRGGGVSVPRPHRLGKGLRAAADNTPGGALHGHRRRPGAPHRLEPRGRHHRGRRRPRRQHRNRFSPIPGSISSS